MNCPNCGLANPDNAKFCANCGTQFGSAPPPPGPYPGQSQYQGQQQYQTPPPYQPAAPYQAPGPPPGGNSLAKNIGIGCLIFIVIVFIVGVSCTRACFGFRHRSYVHRYY